MRHSLTALAFGAAACAAPETTDLEAASRQALEAAPIVISLDTSGPRPALTLNVDGVDYPAVFDTGAMSTVVNISRADDLGLRNEGPLLPPFDRAHAAGGYQTTLRGAAIGGYALPEISAAVLPSPLPEAVAILSPSIFSGKLVTLDLAAGELRVEEKTDAVMQLGEAYGYSASPFALPAIPVTIGGETVAAHIDTGSPVELIFPMAFASRLPLTGELEQVGIARSHFGERPIYRARITGTVRVGPLDLADPEVRFTDAVPNVNLGTALLRRLLVTLDPQEQRLWVRQHPTGR